MSKAVKMLAEMTAARVAHEDESGDWLVHGSGHVEYWTPISPEDAKTLAAAGVPSDSQKHG